MSDQSFETEYVVYCETHRDYLKFVGGTGTTWRADQAEAKRYATKPAARADAHKATWLDHRPIVWALPTTEAHIDAASPSGEASGQSGAE